MHYEDIEIVYVLKWLLYPIIVIFLLPLLIVVLLYVSSLIAHIYKLRWKILGKRHNYGSKWVSAQRKIAYQWILYGRIYHGHEVRGLENIPDNGPALIIFYHGAVPVDLYSLYGHVAIYKNRILQIVADHFLFKVPGFRTFAECVGLIRGTADECTHLLKEGRVLAIAPGGVYEAQFGSQYELMWKNRLGFAKVAINAKSPIIPMFTENINEAFRTVSVCRGFFLKLYSVTRFPFVPICGGFPVKLITHVGKPIPYDAKVTPEQLQMKVISAINELISTNQRIPGNVIHALVDRIPLFKERHKLIEKKDHIH